MELHTMTYRLYIYVWRRISVGNCIGPFLRSSPRVRSLAQPAPSISLNRRSGATWLRWSGDGWDALSEADAPVITHPHFTGTGTRELKDNGRKAIEGLFRRSFD